MTEAVGRLLLAGAVVAPVVGAVLALCSRGFGDRRRRAVATLGWVSATCAVGTAAAVAVAGPFVVWLIGLPRLGTFGLLADRLTVSLLVLVAGVGATVQSYSLRYLRGSPRAERVVGSTSAVVAAMAVVCVSATLGELVVAWVAVGLCFTVLVGTRRDLPGVRTSSRRTCTFLLTGDAALVAALAIVAGRVGPVDLQRAGELTSVASRLGKLAVPVAVLVAVASLVRSAQGPFGGWLPGTVAAPTPVSALLHAGIVNGGGVLLIRLGALASDSQLAMGLALALAATGAVSSVVIAPRKSDVKGTLVVSTMGQMGFMIAECAVGAYLAAAVHLLSHAMYKATLFLGSGSQVPRRGRAPAVPARTPSLLERLLVTVLATAAGTSAFFAVSRARGYRGESVLLALVAATVVTAAWAWSGRSPRSLRAAAAWVCAMTVMTGTYGLVAAVVGAWLAPAMPAPGAGSLSVWWLLALALAGGALSRGVRTRPACRWSTAVLTDVGRPRLELSTRCR